VVFPGLDHTRTNSLWKKELKKPPKEKHEEQEEKEEDNDEGYNSTA